VLLLLLLCHEMAVEGLQLLHARGRSSLFSRLTRLSVTTGNVESGFDEVDVHHHLNKVINNVCKEDNITATLVSIIALGDAFKVPGSTNNSFYEGVPQSWERVPGCMADARVNAYVLNNHVVIEGVADSRVAQGLIALLSDGLKYMPVANILELSGEGLTTRCGLDSVLPPGRLNGLHSLLAVIQGQLRRERDTPPRGHESIFGRRCDVAKGDDTFASSSSSSSLSWGKDEVAMLISGGVDSSVALALLLEQGYKVRAFYLKIWLEDEVAHLNECPWEEDLSYAQRVCDQLGVPLETVSLQKEYWDKVVQYTFDEARLGRTPNPDIMCNSHIKFGMFYEYVGNHFQKVATGHYAQVRTKDDGSAELFMSPDSVKDQTYFLCNLRQDQLQRCLFPIGHLEKHEVRKFAEKFKLATEKRKDSQGICFLGKLKFDEFIAHYLGEAPGPIKEYQTDRILGEHNGLWFHTIGQRKGVGAMLGPGVVNDGPWFVSAKDADVNTLYITNDPQVVDKPRREFTVDRMNWIEYPFGGGSSTSSEDNEVELDIRLRHGPAMTRGRVVLEGDTLLPLSDTTSSQRAKVTLIERDKGIAPGQFAAFYRNNVCLGAGVISEVGKDYL
jgi:tRNA-5-taurinomethyluridine 2-sulfurtransferase